MSATVEWNSDVVFESDLRDAAASSKPATAISLEVSGLASFSEDIDDLRKQEYVEKGKLHRTSWMVKEVDGTTTFRTVYMYAFTTTNTTSPGEGDAAAGIGTWRRRAGNYDAPQHRLVECSACMCRTVYNCSVYTPLCT